MREQLENDLEAYRQSSARNAAAAVSQAVVAANAQIHRLTNSRRWLPQSITPRIRDAAVFAAQLSAPYWGNIHPAIAVPTGAGAILSVYAPTIHKALCHRRRQDSTTPGGTL